MFSCCPSVCVCVTGWRLSAAGWPWTAVAKGFLAAYDIACLRDMNTLGSTWCYKLNSEPWEDGKSLQFHTACTHVFAVRFDVRVFATRVYLYRAALCIAATPELYIILNALVLLTNNNSGQTIESIWGTLAPENRCKDSKGLGNRAM